MGTYTTKYLKIYTAEIVSILLGIISLFVVVPYISGNKEIYGVYSLCISTWVFLSYADLGFLGAATKYAAEYYQLKERKNEEEILSFGSFILFIIASIIAVFFIFLCINPSIIIKDIDCSPFLGTAKQMFGWMAFFSPFVAFQRLASSIYSVRVETYIPQLVNIIGSVLKILSVFYFFSGGRYDIIHYYIFIQSISVICTCVSFIIAKKRYNYDLTLLIRFFRWNPSAFEKTKDLALSSFANTLSWILYYELDQVVIGRFYGASYVATFAIAFAILNYIRMFLSGLFSPFTARFAHFKADNNINGLRAYFEYITNITLPIVVLPLIALSILIKDFIVAWSGPQYIDAVPLTTLFAVINIFAFLSYPTGNMITVFEKTKTLKLISIILPIVYWGGIIMLPKSLSLLSFGIMKVCVFWLIIPVYSIASFKILDLDWRSLFINFVKYNILSILVVSIISIVSLHVITISEKNFLHLFAIISLILTISIVGYSVAYICNPYIKNYISKSIIKKLRK